MLALDQIKSSKKKGFTLIEIVIVLAIAALILVIVFLAVAGAQRSQRDNASKDATGKVYAGFSTYLSDNDNVADGGVDFDTTGNYLKKVKDGRGIAPANGSGAASTTKFVYSVGGTCGNNGAITAGASGTNSTTIAVAYWSESAGASICKVN